MENLKEAIAQWPSEVNFTNPNHAKSGASKKIDDSVWCPECYEPVYQKVSTRKDRSFSCNWLKHRRNLIMSDSVNYSCTNYSFCGWDMCKICYQLAAYDLSCYHQLHTLKEGLTPLAAAAKGGHVACVQLLLDAGATVDAPDEEGVTALLVSASAGHSKVVKALIAAGADINSTDADGMSALFMAAENSDRATVKLLLDAGADATILDNEGSSCLHAAASVGHVPIMQMMLQEGLEASATNQAGDQPLHWLSRYASAAATQLLLTNGGGVNAPNNHKYTPLLLCGKRGCAGAVKALLDAGADPLTTTRGWGTALEASANEPSTVKILLEHGVDPNIHDCHALWKAVRNG